MVDEPFLSLSLSLYFSNSYSRHTHLLPWVGWCCPGFYYSVTFLVFILFGFLRLSVSFSLTLSTPCFFFFPTWIAARKTRRRKCRVDIKQVVPLAAFNILLADTTLYLAIWHLLATSGSSGRESMFHEFHSENWLDFILKINLSFKKRWLRLGF